MAKRSLLNSVDVGTAIFGYDASLKNGIYNVLPTYIGPTEKFRETLQRCYLGYYKIHPKALCHKRNTASLSLYENTYFLTE